MTQFKANLVLPQGKRIRLVAPDTPALREFLYTLPNCRWHAPSLSWMCDATPAAAWRLMYGEVKFECQDAIREMAYPIAELRAFGPDDEERQPPLKRMELWGHQALAYNTVRKLPAAMLNMGMGTGKSATAIALMANRGAKRVLIVCPKSVINVWRGQLEKHCPVDFMFTALNKGNSKKNAELLKLALLYRSGMAVVCVNYESVWRKELLAGIMEVDWDVVVADESQKIGAHNSVQSKTMAKIGEKAKSRLALTGTAMHNSPLDIFGQYRFLDSGMFGTSHHWFKNRYAVLRSMGQFDIVVGIKNEEEMARRMELITYYADRSVLDLPELQHIPVELELSEESQKIYDQIENEAAVMVQDGLVTASNALVQTLRLQQVTGGFVMTEDGRTIDTGREKIEALEDIVTGLDGPCVVFCKFTHDVMQVRDLAVKLKLRYGEISGRQKDLTDQGTMPEGIDLMGVQVQSGGVGVDLTRCRYFVFYDHPWSLGDFEQALARGHRPGQTQDVRVWHLLCKRTVDMSVWEALLKKKNVAESVIQYLRGEE